MIQSVIRMKRLYVEVTSDLDTTGYMQPKAIAWKDCRLFIIDAVMKNFIVNLVLSFEKKKKRHPPLQGRGVFLLWGEKVRKVY